MLLYPSISWSLDCNTGSSILGAKVKDEFSKIELDVGCVKDLTRHRVLVYVLLRRRPNTSKIRITSFAINKLLYQGFNLECSVSYCIHVS